MTALSVTLDEVLAAASLRSASLVPETSGYLALAIGDATARLPFRVEDRKVTLTTEGTVVVARGSEVLTAPAAAACVRDILARLLASSAGSMPGLAATARARAETEAGVEGFVAELEAALIPVNRAAARRALARLARETVKAKQTGKLKRVRAPAPAVTAPAPAPAAPARVEPVIAVAAPEPAIAVAAPEPPPRAVPPAEELHENSGAFFAERSETPLPCSEAASDDVEVEFSATPAPVRIERVRTPGIGLELELEARVEPETEEENEEEEEIVVATTPTPTAIGGYAVEAMEPSHEEPVDEEPANEEATTLDVLTSVADEAAAQDPWGDHAQPAAVAEPTPISAPIAPLRLTSDVLTAPQSFEVGPQPAALVVAAPVPTPEPAPAVSPPTPTPAAVAALEAAPPTPAPAPAAKPRVDPPKPLRVERRARPRDEVDLGRSRRSSVDDLLGTFSDDATDDRAVRRMSASLKQLAGLEPTPSPLAVRSRPSPEPTPPPPPASRPSAPPLAPTAPAPRKRSWLAFLGGLMLLGLLAAAAWELRPDLMGALGPGSARAAANTDR